MSICFQSIGLAGFNGNCIAEAGVGITARGGNGETGFGSFVYGQRTCADCKLVIIEHIIENEFIICFSPYCIQCDGAVVFTDKAVGGLAGLIGCSCCIGDSGPAEELVAGSGKVSTVIQSNIGSVIGGHIGNGAGAAVGIIFNCIGVFRPCGEKVPVLFNKESIIETLHLEVADHVAICVSHPCYKLEAGTDGCVFKHITDAHLSGIITHILTVCDRSCCFFEACFVNRNVGEGYG